MDELGQIPWSHLTHAYGPADDVPGLLRSLKTASPDLQREESPLWQLFGNIWHQGTVYEATSYAVPFLIELAADPNTPDRTGILHLIACIATGHRAVHGNRNNEPEFEEEKARECAWVTNARRAVVEGVDSLVEMTSEDSAIRLAAANVLARLPEQKAMIGPLLRHLLSGETRSIFRIGLLLLMGITGDRSDPTLEVLNAAANDEDASQRHAAAVAIAHLCPTPLSDAAKAAVIEAIHAHDLSTSFEDLPWSADSEVDRNQLLACLEPADREEVAKTIIVTMEKGESNSAGVHTLVNHLFPQAKVGQTPRRKASELSQLQARAVRAMVQEMKTGKRIFYSYFPSWGLPDTMREWQNLAEGREPTPIDMSLPLLASPDDPRQVLKASELKVGQRIRHRHFGLGVVMEIEPEESGMTELVVDFDEEGEMELGL